MREAQGFLLVFSITSMSSLQELAELREQIVNVKNDPYVPIVLVGNKSDLEEDRTVSRSRAFAVSQAWGNVPYYETSARRRQNVSEVFVDVCRQIIRRDLARGRGSGGGGGPSRAHTYEDYDHTRYEDRDTTRRRGKKSKRQRYVDDDDYDYGGGRDYGRDSYRPRGSRRSRCVIL